MNPKKLLTRLTNGHHKNVSFSDFTNLVEAFGFRLDHIKGSHRLYLHRYTKDGLNLQSMDGEAKPYQIKQFLEMIDEYSLTMKEDK